MQMIKQNSKEHFLQIIFSNSSGLFLLNLDIDFSGILDSEHLGHVMLSKKFLFVENEALIIELIFLIIYLFFLW
jgi:hypothetical protein